MVTTTPAASLRPDWPVRRSPVPPDWVLVYKDILTTVRPCLQVPVQVQDYPDLPRLITKKAVQSVQCPRPTLPTRGSGRSMRSTKRKMSKTKSSTCAIDEGNSYMSTFFSEKAKTRKVNFFMLEAFSNTFQIIYRVQIIFENGIKIKKKRHAFFLKKNLWVFSSSTPKIIAYWSANSKKSPKNVNVCHGISNNMD